MTTAPKLLECHARLSLGTLDLEVHLEAAQSELVVLVGPNGAGKSTLLRILAGLQPIDDGRVVVGGTVVDEPGQGIFIPCARRGVGFVFQDGVLFDHLSVVENVAFGLRCRGIRPRPARRGATAWLARLGVADTAELHPHQLSGGQAQRVGLARALAYTPELVLLDEPFAALDATTRVEVRRELQQHLLEVDAPKVLVTHDPIEAMALADRIMVLEEGRVVQQGTPDEIRQHPRSRYVADLLGINLLRGALVGGKVALDGGFDVTVVADGIKAGPVIVTLPPRAITLHRLPPEGSARNVWPTRVADLDDEGDRVRVRLDAPLPLVVEITRAARADLELAVGKPIWASFKATEVGVQSG
jgi:molybdate transport system ATP-binding protein